MIRYVSDEENLKRIMNALRDRSKHIQLEAFHVFKVFVANPKKTPAVESILRRNRSRLLTFLQGFLPDRTGMLAMAHPSFTSHYSHTHTRACILIGAAFSLCCTHSFACFFFFFSQTNHSLTSASISSTSLGTCTMPDGARVNALVHSAMPSTS